MEFPKESQNYIDDIEPPVFRGRGRYLGVGELRTEKFKCKNCSWTGNQTGLTLGGHLVQKANLSCRLLYMRELKEKEAPLAAYMEEAEPDQPSAGTSTNDQSDADAAELNMLVPEVKIRLAKERPFRCSEFECSYTAVTRAHLVSHVKSVHKVGPIPVAITYYKCDRCSGGGSLYSNRNTLIAHIYKRHGLRKVEFCSKCSFASTTEGMLEKHVRHAHKQVGLNNEAQKVSLVPVQSKMLQNHIKIAHGEIKDTPSTSLEGSPNKRVKVIEVGSNDEASEKGMYRVLKSGVLKLKAEHVPTPKSYECQYCPHKTMAKDIHLAHVRSNHEGFACQECGQCFDIEYQLKAHNAAYHNHADKYRCDSSVEEKHEIGSSTLLRRVKCEYSTTGKKELQDHVFRVHGSATIRYCGQCFFAATVVAAAEAAPPSESGTRSADEIIVKHMVEAHGSVEELLTQLVKKPLKCNNEASEKSIYRVKKLCNENYRQIHMKKMHGEDMDSSSSSTPIGTLKCKVCRKDQVGSLKSHTCNIASLEEYEAYVKVQFKPRVNFCQICDRKLCNDAYLKVHLEKMHGIRPKAGPVVKTPDPSLKCNHCAYKAINKDSLRGHVRANHEGFACQECGYSFGLENQLKAHNAAYHNHADKYRCESTVEVKKEIGASTLVKRVKCEYSTTGKEDFQEHVSRVHDQTSILFCGQCFFTALVARTTSSKSAAANCGIMLTHMAEAHGRNGVKRTFACGVDTCKFSATSKANLNTHMGLVHKFKNNDFVCKECGKRFPKGVLLLQHMENAHRKTSWHFCEACKKFFQDKALLDKHLVTFHKNVKCYDCDYISKDPFDLSNHVRVAHMGMPRYDFIQKKEEVATVNVPPPVLPEVILSDVPVKSEPMMTEEEYQVVSFLDVDSNAKSDSNSGEVIDSDPIDVGDTDNNDMSVKSEPM